VHAKPEVSVVIPTRNRWDLLSRHALASALAQQDVETEVIVVDDGSDDGSAERLATLDVPRVRVVRRPERGGQAQALNAGTETARGEWLAFLDDDDVWSPRKLRAQLDAADRVRASFVYGSIVVIDARGSVLGSFPAPDPRQVRQMLRRHNVLRCPSSVMARAELVRRIGGFDESLNELTDWDFFLRLADAGTPAACQDFVVGYVVHPQNRRVRDDCDVEEEFRHLAAKHAADEFPLERAGFARWVAMGHLRAGRPFGAALTYLGSSLRDRDPGNALRAAAALLGERGFRLRRRLISESADVAWLDLYR
jgi:glycosyltransferase involved in cell wall biosynthesis